MRLADRLPLLVLGALLATVACGAPQPPVTPVPTPTAEAAPPNEPIGPQPPIAVLSFPGGQPTAGDLGTYVYRGTGSDSPWLPGEPVAVPPVGALGEVFLSESLLVTAWSARVSPAGRPPGAGDLREIASGHGRIVFELPTGAWTLQLSAQFGNEIGDATYYWQLGQG